METRRRAGKMQRGHELAGRRACILRFTPALSIGQDDLWARNGLCDRQVACMADAAAIGMGRTIMVMDPLRDGGGGL